MIIWVDVHIRIGGFISLGYIAKSRIAGLYGSSIFQFFEEALYCILLQLTQKSEF